MIRNVLNNFLLTMLMQRPAELLTTTLMMDMCPKLDRSHRTACFWGSRSWKQKKNTDTKVESNIFNYALIQQYFGK